MILINALKKAIKNGINLIYYKDSKILEVNPKEVINMAKTTKKGSKKGKGGKGC